MNIFDSEPIKIITPLYKEKLKAIKSKDAEQKEKDLQIVSNNIIRNRVWHLSLPLCHFVLTMTTTFFISRISLLSFFAHIPPT